LNIPVRQETRFRLVLQRNVISQLSPQELSWLLRHGHKKHTTILTSSAIHDREPPVMILTEAATQRLNPGKSDAQQTMLSLSLNPVHSAFNTNFSD
jgi:hypothetical protein